MFSYLAPNVPEYRNEINTVREEYSLDGLRQRIIDDLQCGTAHIGYGPEAQECLFRTRCCIADIVKCQWQVALHNVYGIVIESIAVLSPALRESDQARDDSIRGGEAPPDYWVAKHIWESCAKFGSHLSTVSIRIGLANRFLCNDQGEFIQQPLRGAWRRSRNMQGPSPTPHARHR